ncbi:hypothetical protein B0H10DRAFT_1964583 [Mycena sp. CBHHK59/15]|nr:hypothetical protein B0H10DRAFT_1964583 [Mycena sp. CBHHK59/15]
MRKKAFVLSIVSLCLDPYLQLAVKLVAIDSGVAQNAVTAALAVYLLEIFLQIVFVVCLLRPNWLPLHRSFRPRVRYHRTHISQLRLDRAAKYGLIPPAAYSLPSATTNPHFSSFPIPSFLRPFPTPDPSPLSTTISLRFEEDEGYASDTSLTDGIPELIEVSDEESDDDNVEAIFMPSRSEIDNGPLHSPRCRRTTLVIKGGGHDQPESPPPPIDVTSDEEDPDLHARRTARYVPLEARLSVIPDGKVSVSDLLHEAIPPQSTDPQPASFSNEPENMEGTSSYWYHTLTTALRFLPGLCASFNGAWLSGAKSICFPHLPGKHYPLWTENFLSEIQSFITKRSRWQSAREWLDGIQVSQEDDPHANPHANLLERFIPGLSPAVRLTSQDLTSFLGNDWLNDEMINGGVDYILRRLEPWSRIRVLNCLFIQSLTNAHAAGGSYHPPKLSPIDKAIRAGNVNTVYFPLHVSGNHWTLLKIDLMAKTIAFADSLGGSPPLHELALVQWWLQSLLPDSPPFTLVPPDFHCPRQQDGHSCGVIVLSILASILLDYAPWTPEDAEWHRIQWFLNLAEPFPLPEHEFDTDSDFDHCAPGTTPEPSDFEDGVLVPSESSAPSDFEDSSLSWAVSPLESSPSSPMICDREVPPRLHLDDVDFFLDLPPSKPIVTIPEQSSALDPTSTTDDWISVPQPCAHYYESDGDDSDSDSHESQARCRRRRHSGGPKAGSSWARQKDLKSRARDPEFQANATRLGTFRNGVLKDDPRAEFDDSDVRRVRCSRCSAWVTMWVLYDLVRWREHRKTGKCKKHTGSATQSLFSLGFKKLSPDLSTPSPPRRSIPLPCPGLTRESNEKIANYMSRTSVSGGGAPSRSRLAVDLFSTQWADLTTDEQRMVLRREITLQKWKIGRAVGAVFSASCLRDVQAYDDEEPQPCTECEGLYKLHTFQVALNRPMPDENSLKYVPVMYRDKELGTLYLRYHGVRDLIELDDGRSPWLKFAQGCVNGTYSSDTLTGMVKAMVLKSARVQKGKSLKNLRYPAKFDQFCNLLASTSPRVYLTFQKSFGGPGLRAMRAKRAKLPRFKPDLSAFNVATAAETLKRLKYDGPVALSWDDTALEACISVYQESKDICLIVGGADGAIRVTKQDDLDELFKAAQLKKADKLRVWVLSIPLPKIPPILVAAIARGSSTKADDLFRMHQELAQLLHEADIHPISLASDGAEVERAAQRMIADSTEDHYIYHIPNPTPGCQITLKIPLSRPPQTVLELMAMYRTVPKTSKAEETVEACEMALAAEGLDKSLAIAALPDSTDESLDDLGLLLEAILATPLKEPPVWSLADYALPLTLSVELHDIILVAERMRHQTKSTAKAVRQYGRLSTIMEKCAAGHLDSESGPSLHETLLKRLAAAVPTSDALNKTTGVDRYVRHAGTFGGSGAQTDVRVQNKATVKSVAATKFGAARAKAFANVQWMHENMYLAGIMELNPLKPDDFVIVLKTSGASPEVVLGTVITMYTKNTMHDWIPNTSSVGTPSYICILVYRQFAASLFSSVACEKLSCPTVLQIPRTHILFSLASFKIARQYLPTTEGYPHTMATLCPASLKLFQTLRQGQAALQASVRDLVLLLKNSRSSSALGTEDTPEDEQEVREDEEE